MKKFIIKICDDIDEAVAFDIIAKTMNEKNTPKCSSSVIYIYNNWTEDIVVYKRLVPKSKTISFHLYR
jgi:hypothetical protein